MGNQTAARETSRKDGKRVSYGIAASTKVYKGEILNAQHGNTPTSEGYAIQPRAAAGSQTDSFLGIAYETVDTSAGADGAKSVLVDKSGVHAFVAASADITWIGKPVYASDSQTVTLTSTNAMLVGYVVGVDSATQVRVRIDRAVQ